MIFLVHHVRRFLLVQTHAGLFLPTLSAHHRFSKTQVFTHALRSVVHTHAHTHIHAHAQLENIKRCYRIREVMHTQMMPPQMHKYTLIIAARSCGHAPLIKPWQPADTKTNAPNPSLSPRVRLCCINKGRVQRGRIICFFLFFSFAEGKDTRPELDFLLFLFFFAGL